MERLGEIIKFNELSEEELPRTCGVLVKGVTHRCRFKPRVRFVREGKTSYACNIPRHQQNAMNFVCGNANNCTVFKQRILYDYMILETIETIHMGLNGKNMFRNVSSRLNALQKAKKDMDETRSYYMRTFEKYMELKKMVHEQSLELETSLSRAQRSKRCHDLQQEQLNRIVLSPENFCLRQVDLKSCNHACSVCLESVLERSGGLPCEHVFHIDCIRQWFLRGNMTCPTCRTSVTMEWILNTVALSGK